MALKLSPLRGSPFFSYIPAIAAPWKGAHIEAEQDLMPAKKNHVKVSVRQPIKKISRVPRYQNSQEVVGFCDFLVKPSNIGGTDGAVRGEPSLLRLSRVATEVDKVKFG